MANRTCRGSKVKTAKLTEKEVAYILVWLKIGCQPKYIAERLMVSVSTISRIKNNQTWKHVRRKAD